MAQKSAELLIGKESFRRDLINFIEGLKDKDGGYLTQPITQSKCIGDSECNVTAEYFLETPLSVSYKDVTLIPDTTAPATILNLRINFFAKLS